MPFLPCQEDPDLRRTESPVRDCRRTENGWWVVLDRSPFFPGGGGQPPDRGWIDGEEVREVRLDEEGRLVHRLDRPVQGTVRAEVDEDWRLEVSQQHTAQHLVTATALALLGWRTVAFHLGPERSDIELHPDHLAEADLDRLWREVNARVREARPVRIRQAADREEMAVLGVRSRRLPEGLDGPFRLVEIEGVDRNTCGGTHVRNTSEIQGIHFLGTERIARGTRLFFLAGNRLFREIDRGQERDRALTIVLTCGREEHLAAVARLRDQRDDLERQVRDLRKRLATAIAEEMAATPGGGPAFRHCPGDDIEFLREVAEQVHRLRPDLPVALIGTQGLLVLRGPESLAGRWFQEIRGRIALKGGGRQGSYQGRGPADLDASRWQAVLGESFLAAALS